MLFEVKGWGLEGKKIKKDVVKNEKAAAKKLKRAKAREENAAVKEQESSEEPLDPSKENKTQSKSNKNGKKRQNDDAKQETHSDAKRAKFNLEEMPADPTEGIDTSKLTALQKKMLAKLSGSRFRWINEQLYTTNSASALTMIQKQPELFDEYHRGFASQVESWPENPVDLFIRELVYKGVSKMVNSPGGLPGVKDNRGQHKVVVADMGCGEAKLAIEVDAFMDSYNNPKEIKTLMKKFKKKFGGGKDIPLKNKKLAIDVHSFDLKRINDKITVADIKNVPLNDNSCSIAIFCLSLMGTNFLDFIKEADRILVAGGELWITEIKSRLSDPKGEEFIKAIESLGFKSRVVDDENKMFTKFEFMKPLKGAKTQSSKSLAEIRDKKAEGEWLLKPCIYKRR